MLLRVIHERIPLREWLGHMSLFHANVQIRNDSARTLYITMLLVTVVDDNDNEEDESLPTALVPPHTLEPGYSHLYSIPPPQHQRARVTLAFRDGDADSAVCELLLRSGDRLRVVA
jgi:hypothetical protein